MNRASFKNVLLATAAVMTLSVHPAQAKCRTQGMCPKPEKPGKTDRRADALLRAMAPNTETRDLADEVLVLKPFKPGTYTVGERDVNYFASGSHWLTEDEKQQLRDIVARHADKKPRSALVTGYADAQRLSKNSGKLYEDNIALSRARAQSVADFLKSLPGWENVPVTVYGAGESATGKTCERTGTSEEAMQAYQNCMAGDRRTEVAFWFTGTVRPPPPPPCKDRLAHDAGLPMRITIDGEPLNTVSDTPNSADVTRCTDVALEQADIQVRYDGLEVSPALNVTVWPEAAVRGEEISFIPYSNYESFIERAEIRFFEHGASTQKKPLKILPVRNFGEVTMRVPSGPEHPKVDYVLRVYDRKGRFDETVPKTLHIHNTRRKKQPDEGPAREKLVGYGENHLGISNIPVSGGTVTVNGDKVGQGQRVTVMGREVPVDGNGKFATRQILPHGEHDIRVTTGSGPMDETEFVRPVDIPWSEWFYVGLADVTAGRNDVKGPAGLVTGDDSHRYDEDAYFEGRLAYYMKAKMLRGWTLTSSADTQENPIDELFTNFLDDDPRSLLRRLDSDQYYPVFGDDSTIIEDAPTNGKFYAKLEKSDSHLMWGNFSTKLTGTDLMDYRRSLYGGNLRFNSMSQTEYGERRTEIEGFAADPGTLDAIEEFRGTGGSLYYMRNQDIVSGSERLHVEIRDRNSGIVLETRTLVYGEDYDINYLQGRVVLNEPLQSTADPDTFVLDGSLGGHPVYLIAVYEYTPGVAEFDNMTFGGRGSHWLNDHIRVGATGYKQDGAGAYQSIFGGDVTLRYKPGTYVKLEGARSEGAGTGALSSQNGGFDFGAVAQTVAPNISAHGYRAEVAMDINEVIGGEAAGVLSGYWVKRDNGFSAPGQLTSQGIEQSGGKIELPIGDRIDLVAKGDYSDGSVSGESLVVEGGAEIKVLESTTLTLGARHDDRDTGAAVLAGASTELAQTGKRTDGIVKITWAPVDSEGNPGRYEFYGLGQYTFDADGTRVDNNRYGGGMRIDVADRLSLNGEVTDGDGGVGAQAGIEFQSTDRTSHYINYILDTGRSDTGYRGRSTDFVVGSRSRYSDSLSVYSENRYEFADQGQSGLIHSFGLDYAADDSWTFGGLFESGTTSDPATGDLERTGASVSVGFVRDKVKYGGKLEWRKEEGNTTGKRTSWLTKNSISWQTSEDWRAIGGFDLALSDAGTGSTLDADYTEATLGFAYRPVDNDRLNALLKYTYLQDLGSPAQVSSTGLANTFEQRSHVFAFDAIYDVTPKLSAGAKFGYRLGEIRDTSIAGSPWFDSQAWLGIGRLDWHVVHKWDVTGEFRYLEVDAAEDARMGALLAIYRHFGQNMKIGVGYNFTDFSDDLTDLDYRHHGPFFNVVGKF